MLIFIYESETLRDGLDLPLLVHSGKLFVLTCETICDIQ